MTDEGTPAVRLRVLAVEAGVVGLVAIVLAGLLLSVWNAHWHEPFAYDGDAMYYAMVVKTIGRYGTYLHNPHLGWPFGQNLADYPEGADNLNWFALAVGQWLTGSAFTAMNLFYLASFGLVAGAAHGVLRVLGVRRLIAGAVALLYAFLPYHFARNETHLQLSMYFMVPVAVLVALLLLSDDPPLTRRTDDGGWEFAWRSRRTWLILIAVALLASGGAYYLTFALLLFAAAAVARALSGGGWRPIVAGAVLIGVGVGVFAINVSPSIVERIRHGTPPGVGERTPTETELYGLRISQLYAPRRDHRIPALARLADDSTGAVVPSENGQQLGVIGALGLSLIVVVFVISALLRNATGWWSGRTGRLLIGLGFLALVSMLVGAISSYSFLLSAMGLREIRAWNRISVVIAFCALAAVAIVADRLVARWSARRPAVAPFLAGAVAVVLLVVGLFDQTSPADRPDYAGIHRRFASDEAFFQAVADRLPAGTPVFELPHVPFPEVPPVNGTAPYDQARGFIFEPQLAWSFGFIRGRHPEYPFAFEGRPAKEWLTDLVAVGFQGLVIDRHGYPDDGAAIEQEVASVLQQPVLASADGRYGFFDLTAFTGEARRTVGDAELAARGRKVLARGPLGPEPAGATPGR
jgi:phosphoglycerol transferase